MSIHFLRRPLIAIAFACTTLSTLPLAAGVVRGQRYMHWTTIDGVAGILLPLVFGGEDTAYTSGYLDHRWRSIRVGMTEDDVHRILGAPQKRWRLDPEFYHFQKEQFSERWSYSPNEGMSQ